MANTSRTCGGLRMKSQQQAHTIINRFLNWTSTIKNNPRHTQTHYTFHLQFLLHVNIPALPYITSIRPLITYSDHPLNAAYCPHIIIFWWTGDSVHITSTHLRFHPHPRGPFYRTECEKSFPNKTQIQLNKRTPNGERPLSRTHYQKHFGTKRTFVIHQELKGDI